MSDVHWCRQWNGLCRDAIVGEHDGTAFCIEALVEKGSCRLNFADEDILLGPARYADEVEVIDVGPMRS